MKHILSNIIDQEQLYRELEGLPEYLAKELGTVDASAFNKQAKYIADKILKTEKKNIRADLQVRFIYQHLEILGKVQNGGDKGFLPDLAKEVKGMDCSLSALSLSQRLAKIPDLEIKFGNPVGHVVLVVKDALERQLYIDAQNGFIEVINTEQVYDENNHDTAYPIYRIISHARIPHARLDGTTVTKTKDDGSDYVPEYLGISHKPLLTTYSNLFMLTNIDSPVFFTQTAIQFRKNIGVEDIDTEILTKVKSLIDQIDNIDDLEIKLRGILSLEERHNLKQYIEACSKKYQKIVKPFISHVYGGKVIQETMFEELHRIHHKKYIESLK